MVKKTNCKWQTGLEHYLIYIKKPIQSFDCTNNAEFF